MPLYLRTANSYDGKGSHRIFIPYFQLLIQINNIIYTKKIRNLPESFRTILSEKGFMAKILIARGQATIYVQKDGYTITQSLGEYVFPADDTGKILSSVTLTSTVR